MADFFLNRNVHTCKQHFNKESFSCFLASLICQDIFVQIDSLWFPSSLCNFDTRNKLFSIHDNCIVHSFTWNYINHFSFCFHPHLLNTKLHQKHTIPCFIWTKFVAENRQAHVRILLQTLGIRCYCLYITWKSIDGCIRYPNLCCDKRLPSITSFPVHISIDNFQIFRNNFFSTWHAVYFQLCIFCFFPFSLNTFFGLFFSI